MRITRPSAALAAALLALGCTVTASADRTAASAAATALADAPDHFIEAAGARLRFRDIGPRSAEPVLLLHGYTDRLEMFEGLADSIARDYRVIVPDLRGFGQSTKFASPADFGRRMVDDVVALIAGAFWEDAASTVADLRVPLGALERGEGLAPFMRWILPDHPDSLIRPISEQAWAANHAPSVVATAQAFHDLALDWRAVERSAVPTVVVVSRRDPMVPNSRLVARRWPRARYVEIADGDHGNITTMPEVLEEFRRIAREAAAPVIAGGATDGAVRD